MFINDYQLTGSPHQKIYFAGNTPSKAPNPIPESVGSKLPVTKTVADTFISLMNTQGISGYIVKPAVILSTLAIGKNALVGALAIDALLGAGKLTKEGLKQLSPHIINTAKWTRGKLGKIPELGKNALNRGTKYMYDGIAKAWVAPGLALTLDSLIAAGHAGMHIPGDIWRVGKGTLNGIKGAIGSVGGIFSKKAKDYAKNQFNLSKGEFGNLHALEAVSMVSTSCKNAAIYNASTIAQLYPNLVLGEGNKISTAINNGAEATAKTGILKTIFGTREDLKKASLGARFFSAAPAKA